MTYVRVRIKEHVDVDLDDVIDDLTDIGLRDLIERAQAKLARHKPGTSMDDSLSSGIEWLEQIADGRLIDGMLMFRRDVEGAYARELADRAISALQRTH